MISSIVRTYETSLVTSAAVDDPSVLLSRTGPAVMLSFLDPCLGIICACLPIMRPLLPFISGPVSRDFSRSTGSSATPLNPKSSKNINISGSKAYSNGGYVVPELIRAEISARMPVGEGPLFTNRMQGGLGSQWPLLDEEYVERHGINMRNDLERGPPRL